MTIKMSVQIDDNKDDSDDEAQQKTFNMINSNGCITLLIVVIKIKMMARMELSFQLS